MSFGVLVIEMQNHGTKGQLVRTHGAKSFGLNN